MEMKKFFENLICVLKKYRFVILVLAIGVALMWIPESSKKETNEYKVISQENEKELSTEEILARILSSIEGAGEVKVMLTKSKGEETLYQEDRTQSSDEDSNEIKSDTVIVADSQRDQGGLIRQINPPSYMGAIIVCRGAGDPAVKLAIVDAVSKVTGLGANQISVLKMK